MSVNFNAAENLNLLFDKLENFLKSKTVIGEPMEIGDATLIPVINISFGMGSGGGDGTDQKGSSGVGGGSGMGVKASPTAIVVIKGDKIDILPIKKSSGLEKLIDMVPEIVEKVNSKKEEKKQPEEE